MGFAFKRLVRFARDTSASSAIEFALIAPVLIFMMLGFFVAFEFTRAGERSYIAATTLSDLATRVTEMNAVQVTAMTEAATAVLGKYGTGDNVEFGIASIVNPLGADDVTVAWSRQSDSSVEIDDDDIPDLGLPVIPDGESVMVAVSIVEYVSPFSVKWFSNTKIFEQTVVRRPRFVTEVCFRKQNDDLLCGNP